MGALSEAEAARASIAKRYAIPSESRSESTIRWAILSATPSRILRPSPWTSRFICHFPLGVALASPAWPSAQTSPIMSTFTLPRRLLDDVTERLQEVKREAGLDGSAKLVLRFDRPHARRRASAAAGGGDGGRGRDGNGAGPLDAGRGRDVAAGGAGSRPLRSPDLRSREHRDRRAPRAGARRGAPERQPGRRAGA